jgi:hypothetical protein
MLKYSLQNIKKKKKTIQQYNALVLNQQQHYKYV